MPGPEYAIVGLIRKAQGIKGEVVVEPFTDRPDVIFASGSRVFAGTAEGNLAVTHDVMGEADIPTLTIAASKPFKKGMIVQFEELRDRDSAELWRGRYLLAPFSELPPLENDQVYLHDLVGMKAERVGGEPIGSVSTYYELPQGIMLDLKTAHGSVLIPYRPEVIARVDVEGRTIVIDDKLGFLDDASTATD
jgi:16S rRNA processing protein RimM